MSKENFAKFWIEFWIQFGTYTVFNAEATFFQRLNQKCYRQHFWNAEATFFNVEQLFYVAKHFCNAEATFREVLNVKATFIQSCSNISKFWSNNFLWKTFFQQLFFNEKWMNPFLNVALTFINVASTFLNVESTFLNVALKFLNVASTFPKFVPIFPPVDPKFSNLYLPPNDYGWS